MAPRTSTLVGPSALCFKENSGKQTRNRYQKGSLKKVKRKGGREIWVFRWRETETDGTRRPRKLVIGSVKEYPTERAARLAVDALNLNINHDLSITARAPRTIADLAKHYQSVELAADNEHLAFSTKYGYKNYLDNWIVPKWGG